MVLTGEPTSNLGPTASVVRSRHVGFTPDFGRMVATQRTDALGPEATIGGAEQLAAATDESDTSRVALPSLRSSASPELVSRSLREWLACFCKYGRPSHFVGPVARETLSTFADRAMNAVDRVGCLPLKYRRSAHGALVNAV